MKIYYIGEAKKDPQKSQILGKLRLRTKREKKNHYHHHQKEQMLIISRHQSAWLYLDCEHELWIY